MNFKSLFSISCLVLALLWGPALSHAKVRTKIDYKLSHTTVTQGQTLKLKVWANSPIDRCTATLSKKTFHGYQPISKSAYHSWIYLGIPRGIKSGKQPVSLTLYLKNGEKFTRTLPLRVKKGRFRKSVVNLSKKKDKLNSNRKQLRQESQLIGSKFGKLTRQQYFEKPFIKPTRGRISSPFGAYRVYNNKSSRKHSGVDIANAEKTPLYAANSGRIILSRALKIHGQTIMIDHGFGVVTVYNHLSKRFVSNDQRVYRGQKIGLMGQTGIATGPHLHWGMSVQNIRVNPLYWLEDLALYN